MIGLTLPVAAAVRDRIERLLVMNTGLAVGDPPGAGFAAWRAYAESHPDLPVGELMRRATPHLGGAEVAAYDAPFPDVRHKAGVRAFPRLVMTDPTMQGVAESLAAKAFWADDWAGKSFMAYGAADPVFAPKAMERLRAGIRGCPPAMVVAEGGHFVQEWGEPIAREAMRAFGASSGGAVQRPGGRVAGVKFRSW